MTIQRPVKTTLIAAVIFGCLGLAMPPVADAVGKREDRATVLEAQAIQPPQSRIEAVDAVDASVAGALVGAIITSFHESDVQVRLDDMQLNPLDLEQSEARGHGRLKLGEMGVDEWIPFTFTALYDTEHATASMPRLQIGSAHAALEIDGRTPLAIDSLIARQLHTDVASRLEAEFPQQHPGLILGELHMHEAGAGHASLQAVGTVNFGDEGWTMATIDALYDTRNQRIVRIDYTL